MAKLSWKVAVLLAMILLVALGLQAGAIKILLDQWSQPEPAATTHKPSAAPSKPVAPPISATPEAERPAMNPPHPVDPPNSVELTAEAQSPHSSMAGAPPSDPDPTTPGADATATAMARLAALAEQTSAVSTPVSPESATPESATPESATPESATPESATPEPVPGLQNANWLKTRNPRHYTVQLFSGKDLDRLKEVGATIASNEPRAYFMTGSRTSPWYSLVLGDYPDATTARAAAADLTASSVFKPWVRRFEDIQSSLR
jgi:septal ring-binding cell division protein DamX